METVEVQLLSSMTITFNLFHNVIYYRDDDGVSYILVGLVGGNPSGCGDIEDHPDYFTYIGHTEASILHDNIQL